MEDEVKAVIEPKAVAEAAYGDSAKGTMFNVDAGNDESLKTLSQKQRARTEMQAQQAEAQKNKVIIVKNKFKNQTCYCGSEVKYKSCCMSKDIIHNFEVKKAQEAKLKADKAAARELKAKHRAEIQANLGRAIKAAEEASKAKEAQP